MLCFFCVLHIVNVRFVFWIGVTCMVGDACFEDVLCVLMCVFDVAGAAM